MPSRSKATLLVALALAIIVVPTDTALAVERAGSEFVIVQPDDVVDDDLFAAAVKVSIEGQVNGDLIAIAAEEVVIDGTVSGSVFAVTGKVTVNGSVGGSLRAAAGEVVVTGSVGDDVVVAAVDVALGPQSLVGADTLAWVLEMSALGTIGEDLNGSQGTLRLGGSIGGDIDVAVDRLVVTTALTVEGDLGYRSERPAEGLEQADVGGVVVERSPLPPNLRVRALVWFGRFLITLFLTIAALTTVWAWPERTRTAVGSVMQRPLVSWGWGALVIFSPLLLAGLGALVFALAPAQASLPLLLMLTPLVLAAAGLVLVVGLVAGIPVAGRIGRRLLPRLDVQGSVLAGSLVLAVLWFVPLLGWLVPFLALPLGLGSWMLALRGAGIEPISPMSAPTSR